MKVILISGKAGHGKTTTAEILKKKLEEENKKVLITNYGDLVKYVCKSFFGWNGEKDETGRTLLQKVGTDKVRNYRNNFWVDFIVDILSCFTGEWDYVLIPDVRFPNEIGVIANTDLEYITMRIERLNYKSPLTAEQQKHISETALDDHIFEVIISAETGELEQKILEWWANYANN